MRLALWQRPLRRELACGAGAGDRPLPRHGEAALLPSRCGFCLARGLRALGGRGLRLCHPAARQCGPSTKDRSPAQAPGGASAARGPAFLRQLPLPGPDLEPLTPGRGQGRVAPGRTLSTGGLPGHKPVPSARAGGGLLQSARHGGAVDQRGQECVNWSRLSCRSMKANAVRLQLHALAYNLANFFRTLVLPDEIERWSLTTLREKVVKIGAKVIAHARYTVFQIAEVAVPRDLFRRILAMIDGLRPRRIARC